MKLLLSTLFVTLPLLNANAQSVDISQTKQALDLIKDFAQGMCADPEYKGSTSSAAVGAKATADVNNLLRKLANINVQVDATVKGDAYKGLLQKDLLQAVKNAADCRKAIFDDLKDRVLPKHQVAIPDRVDPSSSFRKLKTIFGLAASAQIGWNASRDSVERIILPDVRSATKVDYISVANGSSINGTPATVKYTFREGKLVSVHLLIGASYTMSTRLNPEKMSQPSSESDGDESLVNRVCSNDFARELEKKLDALFAKSADLKQAVVKNTFSPIGYGCQTYGCEGSSSTNFWKIGYKDAEAANISVEISKRIDFQSYAIRSYDIREKRQFLCFAEIKFSNELVGGI